MVEFAWAKSGAKTINPKLQLFADIEFQDDETTDHIFLHTHSALFRE